MSCSACYCLRVSCLRKMRSSSRKRRRMTRTTWMKRRRSCCCYYLQVQSDRLLNRQGRIAFTGSTLLRIGWSVIQLNNESKKRSTMQRVINSDYHIIGRGTRARDDTSVRPNQKQGNFTEKWTILFSGQNPGWPDFTIRVSL